MTRLLHEKYSRVAEFIKRLDVAGLSAEQMSALSANPKAMRRWVESLDMNEPSLGTSVPTVEELFLTTPALANLLRRNNINDLDDLADCTAEEVRELRMIGDERFTVIEAVLTAHGKHFSENIDNGARRIPYNNGMYSYRRDQLGDKDIRGLMRFRPRDYMRPTVHTDPLTVAQIEEMSDEELHRFFRYEAIPRIRAWIAGNVR